MASVVRYLVTVALAAAITLSAFYLMHRLIDHDAAAPVNPPPVTSIRFGPVDIPEPARPDETRPPEKPEPKELPPTQAVIAEFEPIDAPQLEPSRHAAPDAVAVLPGGFTPPGDRDGGRTAHPIAAVPPPYPPDAAVEGIEGWVRVAVDIDAQGRVRDVRVLEAEPRGFFEKAAVTAVRRWSWKPAIIDGRPRPQTVVQELTFELEDG